MESERAREEETGGERGGRERDEETGGEREEMLESGERQSYLSAAYGEMNEQIFSVQSNVGNH